MNFVLISCIIIFVFLLFVIMGGFNGGCKQDELEIWKDPCPVGSTFCQDGSICCGSGCCFGKPYVPFN